MNKIFCKFQQWFKPKAKVFWQDNDHWLWFLYSVFLLASLPTGYTGAAQGVGGGLGVDILKTKAFFILLSLLVVALINILSLKRAIPKITTICYWGGIILALLTIFFGEEKNNARRWIKIFGVSVQPAEIIKIGIILMGAYIFSRKDDFDRLLSVRMFRAMRNSFREFARKHIPIEINVKKKLNLEQKKILLFVTSVALGVVFVLFGSLSMGIIFSLITWGILFITMSNRFRFWMLTLFCVAIGFGSYSFLRYSSMETMEAIGWRFPTWKSRVSPAEKYDMTEKEYEALTEEQIKDLEFLASKRNEQPRRAKMAIARGMASLLPMPGKSRARYDLPEASNDFIFAIIIEEYGIWGAIIFPVLFILLAFRIGYVGVSTSQTRHKIILFGIGYLFLLQACINMLVAVGLMPVTGQTMPMISTGGTSLVISSVGIGLVLAIAKDTKIRKRLQMQEQKQKCKREELQEVSYTSIADSEETNE